MKNQARTLVVGSDQLTVDIADWLNAHVCEIKQVDDMVIVELPFSARITELGNNHYAISFESRYAQVMKHLEIDLDVDVFTTSWQLMEIEA